MGEAMFRMSSVQTGVAREISGLKACRFVIPHTVEGSKIRRYNQLRGVVEISLLQGLGYIPGGWPWKIDLGKHSLIQGGF